MAHTRPYAGVGFLSLAGDFLCPRGLLRGVRRFLSLLPCLLRLGPAAQLGDRQCIGGKGLLTRRDRLILRKKLGSCAITLGL